MVDVKIGVPSAFESNSTEVSVVGNILVKSTWIFALFNAVSIWRVPSA